MTKISTGFKVNPLVGAIDENQLLIRYVPKNRFIQLLENEGLWFNRTLIWKDMDACEAGLIPSYNKQIRKELKDEAEYNYLKTMMEFGLAADFGCCFSLYGSNENDTMWHSYTPKPDYGVAVVIRARSLWEALQKVSMRYKNVLLSKVKYLSDAKARSMKIQNAIHSRVMNGEPDWNIVESHFYKREAFSAEREVRAVLCAQESFPGLVKQYIHEHDIRIIPASTPTPDDQPYFRMDARNNMDFIIPTDYSILLTVQQAKNMTNYVQEMTATYLESSETGMGCYVPFDTKNIEKIILHPSIVDNHDEMEIYKRLVESNGIGTKLVESVLYKEAW